MTIVKTDGVFGWLANYTFFCIQINITGTLPIKKLCYLQMYLISLPLLKKNFFFLDKIWII